MTHTEALNGINRLVKTLETITRMWPEVTCQQLLASAQKLPAIMADLPLTDCTTDRAVGLYIENLVDEAVLPPWCG